MIKDQLLIYEDLAPLRMICPSCKKPASHLSVHCPLLSYSPKPASVIQKYRNRNNQKREIFTRNIIRMKYNSLVWKESVEKNQKNFAGNNEHLLITPKRKDRRAGVFDVRSFLNLGPVKKLKSSNNDEENSDISEENEEEEISCPEVQIFFF